MKSKVIILAFSVLIFVSFCGNIMFYQKLEAKDDYGNIVGTYMYGTSSIVNEDTFYLAAESNGTYTLYKQYELLEKDTYTNLYENIYSFGEAETQVIAYKDRIYYVDNTTYLMEKISDIPTYINLPQEGTIQAEMDKIVNELNAPNK